MLTGKVWMARNVEIKARARDFERQRALAEEIADSGPELLVQEDTFFHCRSGRLKLRRFADGTGELISYVRQNSRDPAASDYVLSPTSSPESLRRVLGEALGIRAVVRKRRTLYKVGQTRLHLDEVEQLGEFLELEVVLKEHQSTENGVQVARDLMGRLDIGEGDLVAEAYVDLLESDGGRQG